MPVTSAVRRQLSSLPAAARRAINDALIPGRFHRRRPSTALSLPLCPSDAVVAVACSNAHLKPLLQVSII